MLKFNTEKRYCAWQSYKTMMEYDSLYQDGDQYVMFSKIVRFFSVLYILHSFCSILSIPSCMESLVYILFLLHYFFFSFMFITLSLTF